MNRWFYVVLVFVWLGCCGLLIQELEAAAMAYIKLLAQSKLLRSYMAIHASPMVCAVHMGVGAGVAIQVNSVRARHRGRSI